MSISSFTTSTQTLLNPTHFYRHKRRLRALLIEGQPWFVVRDLGKLMQAFLEERLARNLDPDQLRCATITAWPKRSSCSASRGCMPP